MDLGELNMKFMENWESFKHTLGNGVDMARMLGMSEESIQHTAKNIGDFLDNNIDPENPQQRTMKELWDRSTEEERQHLAKMMVDMVSHR